MVCFLLHTSIADLCFPERYGKKKELELIDIEEDVEHKHEDLHPKEKKHMRILVVDELADTRTIHEKLLAEAGHTVVLAGSGAEALNAIKKANVDAAYGNKETAFDIVLLSHLIHGLTAPQTIEKIRHQGFHGFIIGLTVGSSPADLDEMTKAGAEQTIPKPLTLSKFKKALKGE